MNQALGVALAVAALGLGYTSYGWRGVVLAVTVVVFWLLLQFSQALRVLREAGARPVGTVPECGDVAGPAAARDAPARRVAPDRQPGPARGR